MCPVLVTGAIGQLGTALAAHVWTARWEAVALSCDALDLADPEACTAAVVAGQGGEPWATVINAWAYTAIDRAEGDQIAAWRGGAKRDTLRIVANQHGSRTGAADLAAALAAVAVRLVEDADAPTGTFHFANAGTTTWAGFAAEVFRQSAMPRGPSAHVKPTADYPTPARRPANSLLDTGRLTAAYGIAPRPWQDALGDILNALIGDEK